MMLRSPSYRLIAGAGVVLSILYGVQVAGDPGNALSWALLVVWAALPVLMWFNSVGLQPTALAIRNIPLREREVAASDIAGVEVWTPGVMSGWMPRLLLTDGTHLPLKVLAAVGGKRPPEGTTRQVQAISEWLATTRS